MGVGVKSLRGNRMLVPVAIGWSRPETNALRMHHKPHEMTAIPVCLEMPEFKIVTVDAIGQEGRPSDHP